MTDGIVIVRALLVGDAAMLALVPAERIAGGLMPQGTSLPWLSLALVSSVDRNVIAPGAMRRVTDRVQVTAAAGTFDAMRAVLQAAKNACADQRPTIDGAGEIVVLSQGRGPDFMDEAASIYLGSRDFQVSYNEVRA